ncbi:aminoglycoside phosphotransferase family protein [Nocardioides sp. L-11A]|uniref:aminoglycoside phosphotransferase family protein n=1 Tax=Nocardioides sp. L-11A TaxID=3043848 RepID=UPI00249C27D3|nr:aminoglycoside phosphotransferase family protein [Nocardioides sp. L-11A]
MRPSILILGGSGQAGSDTAALLRRWHPTVPLTIAGRDLDRAQRVAGEVGGATAVTIDLRRRDLGLPDDAVYSAVVAALWDDRLNGLRYAQDRGLPYLSISSGLLDIGPEVVAGAQRASAAPILVASHFCAGIATLAALDVAGDLDRIDSIRLGLILDETDTGGPAGTADLERWSAVTAAGLVRHDGVFTWLSADTTQVDVRAVDGAQMAGHSIPILDVPSLALATGAPDVRVDLAVGESSSRRRGKAASIEIRIDMTGTDATGTSRRLSRYLIHPHGQRPLTAVGIALGVERLAGLRGDPVRPGIHTPESLIDPGYAAQRLSEIGAVLADAPPDSAGPGGESAGQALDPWQEVLARWDLSADGAPLATPGSDLLPVRWNGRPAMLKRANTPEERAGAAVLRWWGGDGAAEVFTHEGDTVLMERATGDGDLMAMALGGRDDEATRILCDTVAHLHRNRPGAPATDLVPLREWFASLAAVREDGPRYARSWEAAEALLADPRDEVVLHGDVHHDNVLDFGARSWLAIDPKCVTGERGYDYANLLTNPDLPTAAEPARFARQLDVIVTASGLPRERLLRWVVAFAGLSAAWFDEDGDSGRRDRDFAVADLAAAHLSDAAGRAVRALS